MRVDKVNENTDKSVHTDVDITWTRLISDSESEIAACKDKISKLRKSIGFFKKQSELGMQFPRLGDKT